MPIDDADTGDRTARTERMIEYYRLVKKGRLQRRAVVLWRKLEARRALVELEKPLARIH
jgi:hypothetical protein